MQEGFYLAIILYQKYLQDDYILLDVFYNCIYEIAQDYKYYDNTKKDLISSIDDYIEERKDFILEKLNLCIEGTEKDEN